MANARFSGALIVLALAAKVDAQELIDFRSSDGRFSIRLPATPSRTDTGPLRTVAWNGLDGSYSVTTAAAKPLPEGVEATLAKMAEAAARAMRCEIQERKPITLGKTPGIELTGAFDDPKKDGKDAETRAMVRLRMYLTSDTLVQVIAQGKRPFVTSAQANQVLDSLRLLP